MADSQEPDLARRLGGGANRQSLGGSGEAVAEKLKGAFKAVAEYAEKAHKSLTDMEKIVDRIDKKSRSSHSFGSQGSGNGNAGGSRFSGAETGGGAGGGGTGGGTGGGGGGGGHLNIGGGANFGGGSGRGPGLGANAPGGAPGSGDSPLSGVAGGLGKASAVGAAVFKAAGAYGKAHMQDAATMELASSRLAIAGGGNREFWRSGSGLARMGGYNLDDNVGAALTLSNMGVSANRNDPRFQALMGQVQGMTDKYGGLGSTSAAQFLQQAHSTQSIYGGRTIGIRTTGQGGAPLGPAEIAKQILAQQKNGAPTGDARLAQVNAALDQGGGIDQRLDVLGLSGEQRDLVAQELQSQASGRPIKKGDNKLDAQTKDTAQSQMETTSQTAKGIADGAADIKHAGEMFRDAVNALLRGSKLGGLSGFVSGGSGQVGGPSYRTAVPSSGKQEGGPGPGAVGSGASSGAQWQQIEEAVHKLGFNFGTPTPGQVGLNRGYGDHGAGRAVDFGDKTSDSAGIARALVPYATGPNAAISQLIYSKLNIGYDSGVNKGEAFYGAKTWADHFDHVHVAVKPGVNLADVVAAGPGSTATGDTAAAPADPKSGGDNSAKSAGIVNSAGDLIPEGLTAAMLGVAASASSSSSTTSSSSTATDTGAAPAGPMATGPLQDYAKKLLAQYGWSNQWDSFNKLEMSEGGWDPTVSYGETPGGGGHKGPHGVAYGIPQALPPEKMASAGADWKTSGYTQLRWMMEYIKTKGSSFHDPDSAWAFHQRNNSYAKGSWEIERDQYARIHAGEMVVPADQANQIRKASGGRGSGSPVTINVTLNNASESEVMRLVQRVKTEMQRDSVLDMIGAS